MSKRILNKTCIHILLLFLLMAGKAGAQIEVGEDTTPIYDAIYFDSLAQFNHDGIQVRTVPDSVLQKIKQDDAFWYADLAPEKNKNKQDNGSALIPSWAGKLIWTIIVISMIAVLVWFVASSNIRLFRKPPAAIPRLEEEILGEDIFEVDFERETSKAISQQNYRLAVRLFYLRTLRDLSHLSLIEYKHERTNSEYLAQLAGTNYYREFFQLTRDFEYVWYGQFELTSDEFHQVQNDFSRFREGLAA